MSQLFDDESLAILERRIDEWLAGMLARNIADDPVTGIVAIDHAEPDPAFRARWYVRMKGESKDFITVWLTLGQRTLRYETYVMPAPEENVEIFNENLLRRNDSLIGAHFSIGEEDAVFLRGDRPLNGLTEAELDRIIGSMYAYVEQVFRPLLAIGFASRLAG
ncbi:MAG: YbjN domain-containing protein [Ilumatobacteraceae bacterium]